MKLVIDNTPIDFTLDNETNLKEVISSISKWLADSQLIIEKLQINSEDYSNKELNSDLENIKKIEIDTISYRDLNINNISWIMYFFNNLSQAIEKWNVSALDLVEKESSTILEHIPNLLSLDNSKKDTIYAEKIQTILKNYNYFKCNESEVNKEEVLNFFNNITVLLKERLNEYQKPKEELKASILLLNSFREEIESISLLLQSGKEGDAASIMTKFTNVFQKLLRIITFNINNKEITGDNNIKEFTNELHGILEELLEGYESQDVVLIGDILEYELSPKIEELNRLIG